MQVEKQLPDVRRSVSILIDTLIPGDQDWPSASLALGNDFAFLEALDDDVKSRMLSHASTLTDMTAPQRLSALRDLEQCEPDVFERFLLALYGAYYTTPLVAVRIRTIATSGEPEPQHFDPALLAQVIQTQAGRRRL
ncbi:hypothetical protein [Microvirga antarctica]|uniref:hypothetical protein n=1 Tax=Microvirga antarctica TaxID=2819233 RepID=UPI001B30D3E9|nr:hypothetical protein [Microvirga antarctica]